VVLIFHGSLGLPLLTLPAIVLVQMIFTVAVLFFVATLNVFYRDLQQLMTYVVMLLFYLTPVFYQLKAVPETLRPFVEASPITVIVSSYQHVFYENTWPDLAHFAYLLVISLVLLVLGHAFFTRRKETFGEYL
jgi:ABC-type polysaccharide/polyol phosphate export permease